MNLRFLLGDHVEPGIALLAPLGTLRVGAAGILVVQAIALAASAAPVPPRPHPRGETLGRRDHRSAVSTRSGDGYFVAPVLDAARARGLQPETCSMDKGYDNNRVMDECRERGVVPIVSLRKGRAIQLLTIPYGSVELKRLYRGGAAVEREYGRLEYGLAPLRTRGIARVRIHADLTMLARLGQALTRVLLDTRPSAWLSSGSLLCHS